jgi:hypothetical protein
MDERADRRCLKDIEKQQINLLSDQENPISSTTTNKIKNLYPLRSNIFTEALTKKQIDHHEEKKEKKRRNIANEQYRKGKRTRR